MSSKAAPQCIRSLTLVLLQLQDQMYRKCDQVLSKLAKVSDTKAVALPVLDFLSCLITLPEIFSSFTKDNYNKVSQLRGLRWDSLCTECISLPEESYAP